MLVRLTKKLAEVVDGIDLSHCKEGDVIALSARHAQLLMAEGWAETVSEHELPDCTPVWRPDGRPLAVERTSCDDSVASKLRQYMRGSGPDPG